METDEKSLVFKLLITQANTPPMHISVFGLDDNIESHENSFIYCLNTVFVHTLKYLYSKVWNFIHCSESPTTVQSNWSFIYTGDREGL
jgi:hypothetical protein